MIAGPKLTRINPLGGSPLRSGCLRKRKEGVAARSQAEQMKRVAGFLLTMMCFSAAPQLARAQRLSVDPAHPYSAGEQKQSEKLYKKSLKQQEKAQKKAQKAGRKEWKKQQKEGAKVNQARQKQIDAANRH